MAAADLRAEREFSVAPSAGLIREPACPCVRGERESPVGSSGGACRCDALRRLLHRTQLLCCVRACCRGLLAALAWCTWPINPPLQVASTWLVSVECERSALCAVCCVRARRTRVGVPTYVGDVTHDESVAHEPHTTASRHAHAIYSKPIYPIHM